MALALLNTIDRVKCFLGFHDWEDVGWPPPGVEEKEMYRHIAGIPNLMNCRNRVCLRCGKKDMRLSAVIRDTLEKRRLAKQRREKAKRLASEGLKVQNF